MRFLAILLLSLPLFAFAAEHGGTAAKEHGGEAAKTKEHGGDAAKSKEHGGDAAKSKDGATTNDETQPDDDSAKKADPSSQPTTKGS